VLVDRLLVEGDIPDWERFFLGVETAEALAARSRLR